MPPKQVRSTRASARKDQPEPEVGRTVRSDETPPQVEAGGSDTQYCVTCSKEADDKAIGCDSCERWVCNTVMCSGLPQQLLNAINEYSGEGIKFLCTQCRISRQSSPTKSSQTQMMELISQLFQQVQGICTTLQGLTDKVTLLTSKPNPQTNPEPTPDKNQHPTFQTPPSQQPTKPDEYRAIIRDEVKEIREREKRRHSVIVKGLKVKSGAELIDKFGHMTGEVMGTVVSLTEVAAIPNHPDMFRAKIMNDDHRKLILEKAKYLRDSSFHSVFISRDLTFAQRAELFQRRQSRRAEQGQRDSHSRPRQITSDGQPAPVNNSVPGSTIPPSQGK